MFCQACRAHNPDDQEYCRRCHQKLLVLSGVHEERDEILSNLEEELSLDEHLLERISALEEAVKRSTESSEHLLRVVQKQGEALALTEAGLTATRELLERNRVVTQEEWLELWQRSREQRLLALEKRDRFLHQREAILNAHRGPRRDQLAHFLETAGEALSALDLESALSVLAEALERDPTNPELARFLGEAHFNSGNSSLARTYFDLLLALDPGHYEGLVYSGVIRHEEGEIDRARELLERAVELFPDRFLPRFSLGAVLSAQGELSGAAAHLRRAVAIDPVPQALFLLGRSLYDLGRTTAAIRCLEDTVRRHPSFEEAFHQLGLAYLDRRWNRKALDAFRHAQRLNPRKFRYRELVRYLSGPGSSPLPEVPGEAGRAVTEGEAALEQERPEDAYQHFRRALGLAPDHPTALTYFALTCLALDRHQEIERAVSKVADGDPGEMLLAAAYATWMEALRGQGRYQEGNRIGERLLAEGQSSFAKTIAYYEMAWNCAEMGEDLDLALELARRALELAPEELEQFPQAALGWVHYKRREFPQAVERLARACQLGPSAASLTQLGMAMLAAGDEEGAREVLDQVRDARGPRGRAGGVEVEVMECLRDSNRLFSRLREARKG